MKSNNSVFLDMVDMLSSNSIILLGSIVTGLIIPIILGATNYGYYRLFVLYSSYTALLHFGFVDGVLLKNGGKKYNDLNKYKFRSNSIVFIIMQAIIAIIFVVSALFISSKIYSIIFICVGINTFLVNVTTYYQYISQAVMRFKELSIRNVIRALLIIIFTLFICVIYKLNVIHNINYFVYILVMLLVYLIIFLIYFISYRSITFGKHDELILGIKRLIKYCRIGIFLAISYQISNLILIIDNQFIASFFNANVYGKYSFSYSMASAALTILSAVSTVLLPHLKQHSYKYIIQAYPKMISTMMLVVYLALIGYFPLCFIVKGFIPEYIQSLSYLKIFLPELGITCCVTMIIFNYYNVLNKSKFYFYMSIIVLLISTCIDGGMYLLFHSPILIAFGSFIGIFIWYILSEYFLIKRCHIMWKRNFIYMVLMVSLFLLASMMSNDILGLISYLFMYLLISILFFKDLICKDLNLIINKL